MLNIPQKPDGTIDEESRYILKYIGSWLKLYGGGIYGTRPWRLCKEGDTKIASGGEDRAEWKPGDIRYTSINGSVYAFLMKAYPGQTVALKAFDRGRVQKVTMHGCGELGFVHELGTLLVRLPDALPSECVNMLTISGDQL